MPYGGFERLTSWHFEKPLCRNRNESGRTRTEEISIPKQRRGNLESRFFEFAGPEGWPPNFPMSTQARGSECLAQIVLISGGSPGSFAFWLLSTGQTYIVMRGN